MALSSALPLIILLTLLSTAAFAAVHCVDSAAGDEAREWRSEATAWRSLERVNATTFAPGDEIRLKRGGSKAEGQSRAESTDKG